MGLDEKMRYQLRYWWNLRHPAFKEREVIIRRDIAAFKKLAMNGGGDRSNLMRSEHRTYELTTCIDRMFRQEKLACMKILDEFYSRRVGLSNVREEEKCYKNMKSLVEASRGFISKTVHPPTSAGGISTTIRCRITEKDIPAAQAGKIVFQFQEQKKLEYYVDSRWMPLFEPIATMIHHPTIVANRFTAFTDIDQCITPAFVQEEVARVRASYTYFYEIIGAAETTEYREALATILSRSGWLQPSAFGAVRSATKA